MYKRQEFLSFDDLLFFDLLFLESFEPEPLSFPELSEPVELLLPEDLPPRDFPDPPDVYKRQSHHANRELTLYILYYITYFLK